MRYSTTTILLLLAIMLIAVLMRLPVVGDVFCDPDVAGAAYSSQELLRGGDLYGDTVETKPPASYLLYAALFGGCGLNMTYVYLASLLFHLGILLILFWLGRAILTETAGLLAAFLYAMYSVTTAANGWCPNFESWPLLPLAAGFYFLWRHGQDEGRRWPFLAGVCGGLAVLFKQNQLVVPACALLLLWIVRNEEKPGERVRAFFSDVGLGLLGMLTPFVLVTLYFLATGQIESFLAAMNPRAAIGYMSTEQLGYNAGAMLENGGRFLWHTKTLWFFFSLLVVLLFWEKWREETNPRVERGLHLVEVWFVAALAAVCLGTKFFGHYFILLVPPLVLIAACTVSLIVMYLPKTRLVGIGLVVLMLAGAVLDNRFEIQVAAKSLSERIFRGQVDWRKHEDYYWRGLSLPAYSVWSDVMREVGECLDTEMQPDETIFVWDYEPGIYWYARRRSPTRHFMYFNVATELPGDAGSWFDEITPEVKTARVELLGDLARTPPAFIVTLQTHKSEKWSGFRKKPVPMFAELQRYVEADYGPDTVCSNQFFSVFRRRDPLAN